MPDQACQDGTSKAEIIKKIHQQTKENLEKKTKQYEKQANKGRRQVLFEPGDWVWLHMRPERFPHKRHAKLSPRGDGPFRVLEKINDNAYKLELPGEFNVSTSFNVTDLSPFDVGEPVLRSKPFEEGGNDADIANDGPIQAPTDADAADEEPIQAPAIPDPPITRARAKTIPAPVMPDPPITSQAPVMPDPPITRARAKRIREEFNAFAEKASRSYSFPTCGFIPTGFPGEVFNEAIASSARPSHTTDTPLPSITPGRSHEPVGLTMFVIQKAETGVSGISSENG